MGGDSVLVERDGARAEIVLNRPHRRNAITPELIDRFRRIVAELAEDESVGAVLLRGAEGTFCSGMDLKELAAMPPGERAVGVAPRWAALHRELAVLPVPLIGALERAAIAGGAALALACDILVVGEGAQLHVSEIELSRQAPVNVAWLLYKHTPAVALETVLAAPRYGAAALRDRGLAHLVVGDGEVLAASREIADRLAGYDRGTVVALKRSVHAGTAGDFADVLERVSAAGVGA